MGYGGDGGGFAVKKEETALREAASAGIQSVENLIKMLSSSSSSSPSPSGGGGGRRLEAGQGSSSPSPSSSGGPSPAVDIEAATDAAVNKFRKVISLLDRARTGHARFRRAPVAPLPENREALNPVRPAENPIGSTRLQGAEPGSAFKVYCPTPIQRLPPLPHNHHHHQVQQNPILAAPKVERKESATPTTINFSASPPISAANSFLSSLTGETDSVQRSFSSAAFQMTHHLSQVSSADKPPLSYSLKRKCSSMDDAALKCASSSGKCHCSKKRYVEVFRSLCSDRSWTISKWARVKLTRFGSILQEIEVEESG